MRTNIFAQAATMLRKQSIDADIGGFVDFMGHYQAGDWRIYPSSVHRELRMDVATVYEADGDFNCSKLFDPIFAD